MNEIKPWHSVTPEQVSVKPPEGDPYPEASFYVVPVQPKKWDWWRMLRGKYVPTLRVGRNISLRMTDDMLKEFYADPIREALEKEVFAGLKENNDVG